MSIELVINAIKIGNYIGPYWLSQIKNETALELLQVQCSHLLVKHCDSRRPASWRSDNITRYDGSNRQHRKFYEFPHELALFGVG